MDARVRRWRFKAAHRQRVMERAARKVQTAWRDHLRAKDLRLRSALAENLFGGDVGLGGGAGGGRGRAESSAVRSSRGTTARRAESFPAARDSRYFS